MGKKKPADKKAAKAVTDYGNRALSILQPWAWAITDLDKRVENRSKPNRKEGVGGLWIHTGEGFDKLGETILLNELLTDKEKALFEEGRDGFPRGAIVGYCGMEPCLPVEDVSPSDRWTGGPFCYPLNSVQKLREPVPCKGKRGFWCLPADVVALCVAQLGEAPPAEDPGRMHGAKPHVKFTPVQIEAIEETLDKISDLGKDLAPVLADISTAEKKLKKAKGLSSALVSDIGKLQKHLIAIRSGTWQGRLPLE